MKTILRIDSSIRREGSYSRALGDFFISRWNEKHPGGKVIVRDLQSQPIPHLQQIVVDLFYTQEKSDEVAFSNELIREIKTSDDILITCPMYNFQVPSSLKAYIDHVVRTRETFQYASEGYQGLLKNKTAYFITAMGGKKNVPYSFENFENYLKNILGFIGIQNTFTVSVDGTSDPDYVVEAVSQARKKIEELIN